MKKIILMIINMNVGGTEKALLNMISEMSKKQYEITILMLEEYGEFLNAIPSKVHVVFLKGFSDIKDILNGPPRKVAHSYFKHGKVLKAFNILYLHYFSKLLNNRSIFYKYLLRNHTPLESEYDIAVAYAGPMDFISFFVINKINAKKKIQWIHFDITKIGFNAKFALKLYKKFDKIFIVSNEGKEKLDKLLPQFKSKTETFKNIIPSRQIIKLAEEDKGFEDDFQGFRILTVGRLSKEKGQDLTIEVCARLKKEGYLIRWYCIGEGPAKGEYEELIKLKGLLNDYILLGSQSNPYPYMKQCDIYVQSSRHEGYCITLAEAKCFASPIVSTKVTGVDEHLTHKKTGIITEFNEEEMFNSIKSLLNDETLYNSIKKNLKAETNLFQQNQIEII